MTRALLESEATLMLKKAIPWAKAFRFKEVAQAPAGKRWGVAVASSPSATDSYPQPHVGALGYGATLRAAVRSCIRQAKWIRKPRVSR